MRNTTSKKLICFVLAFLMLLSVLPAFVYADDETDAALAAEVSEDSGLKAISEALNSRPYADYKKDHADAVRAKKTIEISATDYLADETTATIEIVDGYVGRSGESLKIEDDGKVTWKVDIPETGLYAIKVDYCSVGEKTNSIERVLYINGFVPFAEARLLLLKKTWVNDYTDGRFEKDFNGNELRPASHVLHEWKEYTLIDSNGYYADPFEFYFEKGENTISFESVREAMVVQTITLFPYEDLPSYEEYVAGKQDAVNAEPIYIPAETPTRTSDYTVYPIYDRKSPITEPQDAAQIRLNTIGSDKWQTVGQWIEYDFDITEAGLYNVVFRFRQNELAGMYTSRKIYIDGKVPFEEANGVKFVYKTAWQVQPANDGDQDLKFYLEPGHHTIRIEVTLGDMGDVVRQVTSIQSSINKDYLEILKLAGAKPDEYRDYGFGRVLPGTITDLVVQHLALDDVVAYIENMANIKSENSATLEEISRLLLKMGTNEDEIAKNLSELKSKVGTLGEWINDVRNQPLEFDYLIIQPADGKLPKAEGNFFQKAWYEIKQFAASFYTDYNSLGVSEDGKDSGNTIDVWVTTGRDQAQIIRNLIDNDFGPNHDVNASLKLVAGGTLLPSVLAGVGPDVALPGTGVDPIEYAIRSAVHAINPSAYEDAEDDDAETKEYNAEMREIFSNFDDVTSRFTKSALIPMTLYGKVYGLPDTQTWPMMFYRTDILADLGLDVPKTWDDLLALIPILQFNNMEIGLSQDYQMYMYQMHEELWADEGMRVNLDSNRALEAFETMCNMFTQYSLPAQFDFANRFRTGEIPIAIRPYTEYNNVIIFATEIAGLWEFGPIPGFEQEDGTIDNTAIATTTALVMMSGCDDIKGAWEFMDWYTDKKFQVDYSNELVAILGPAAKNATANIEALEELPWTSREYSQLMKQVDHTSAITPYPGSYFLNRYTNFAFLDAYNNNADPVDSLLQYINTINKEVNRKRTEFGLETLEIGQTKATKRLGQAEEAIEALDESVKSSPAVEQALAAIESKDTAELEAAAEALGSDPALAQIQTYLNDAVKAYASYND